MGIFPYNPHLILDVITKPLPPKPTKSPKTPISYRAVRRAHHVYKFKPNPSELEKILRVNEYLVINYTINKHVINRLIESL